MIFLALTIALEIAETDKPTAIPNPAAILSLELGGGFWNKKVKCLKTNLSSQYFRFIDTKIIDKQII